MRGLDPTRSLFVLLGARVFPKYPALSYGTIFARSADEILTYVTDAHGLGLRNDNILDLFDDSRPAADQLEGITQFLYVKQKENSARGAPENLFVYYVGHGLFTPSDRRYCLAIRCTSVNTTGVSAMRGRDLAEVVSTHASHLRRFVILDCCFAGSIVRDFLSAPGEAASRQLMEELPLRGTSILCASSRDDVALAPSNLGTTMFTRALLKTLREGNPTLEESMSIREVKNSVTGLLQRESSTWARPELHSSDMREGDIADLPIFPNPAFVRTAEAAARKAEQEQKDRERTEARISEGRNKAAGKYQAGDYADAIAVLDSLIRDYPGRPELQEDRNAAALRKAEQDQIDRTQAAARKAEQERKDRERTEARISEGRNKAAGKYQAGDYADAIAVLDSLIRDYPGRPELQEDRNAAAAALRKAEQDQIDRTQAAARKAEQQRKDRELADAAAHKAEQERKDRERTSHILRDATVTAPSNQKIGARLRHIFLWAVIGLSGGLVTTVLLYRGSHSVSQPQSRITSATNAPDAKPPSSPQENLTKLQKSPPSIDSRPQAASGDYLDSRDGKTYKWVRIGRKIWFARNLAYRSVAGFYPDHTTKLDDITDEQYVDVYGGLYTWDAARSGCPDGWHLATRGEWEDLINLHGGKAVAGRRMSRDIGQYSAWGDWNKLATNELGFSAIPGGRLAIPEHSLEYRTGFATYWSATEASAGAAYAVTIQHFTNGAYVNTKSTVYYALSVRCVEN